MFDQFSELSDPAVKKSFASLLRAIADAIDSSSYRPQASRGKVAADWLVDRFREKREWVSRELFEEAVKDGVSRYALIETPEVRALPIERRRRTTAEGEAFWTWIASNDAWPPQS